MQHTHVTPRRRAMGVVMAALLIAAGCSGGDSTSTTVAGGSTVDDPGDCVPIDMAVSPEKIELLKDLAKTFNGQKRKAPSGKCVFVRPAKKSSGAAATALLKGWDEAADGPRPVIWSPASSAWGSVLNQRLTQANLAAMAPPDAQPFMLTPLVIAMPEPMATALGYPAKPVGFADLARLAQDPQGWAAYGHPEWGQFRLGKTNPNYSTSGLSALIAQTYAGSGKTKDLTLEDLANPKVLEFSKNIESAVVHYGDITLTFLNNWFRADKRGNALTYASAVAVEEKSVIDYNTGNPDGILDPGEEPRPPRIKLVAIYPSEGTLFSDNPFFVLKASWVTDDQRAGAALFQTFVQEPANQQRVLSYGFRPGNANVAVTDPIVASNGVDPNQPQTLLEVPKPEVMTALLESWARNRKSARVLMVLDISGSMGDPATQTSSDTKLDLAKTASIATLDLFKDDDDVGLRVFSTLLGPAEDKTFLDLQPVSPIGPRKEQLTRSIDGLVPTAGTPLYDVTLASFKDMVAGYDPTRINAIVLLTDGKNEDGDSSNDAAQRDALLTELRAGVSGENAKPIRIFTIGYGADADMSALTQIAEASNSAAYNATDAASINKVFAQVVSNF